jgi:ATP-binding cassette, subfamily B, bacterial
MASTQGDEARVHRWWAPDVEGLRSRVTTCAELWRASPRMTVALAGCVLVGAAVPIGFSLGTGAAVGSVAGAAQSGFSSPAGQRLLASLLAVGGLFVFQQSLVPLRSALMEMMARRVRGSMYRRTIVAMLRPPTIAHLEDPELLDQVAQATCLGNPGPWSAVRAVVGQATVRLAGAGALFVLATFRWWLALALLIALVHQMREHRVIHRQLVAAQFSRSSAVRRANYLRDLALRPPAAKESRVFGLAQWIVERFEAAFNEALGELRRRRARSWRRLPVATLPVVVAVIVALVLVAQAASAGDIGVGALVVYAQAVIASLALGAPTEFDLYVEEASAVVNAVRDLEEASGTDPRLRLGGTGHVGAKPEREVRFESVSFRYPGHEGVVLQHLDLVIPAGHSLAIVGGNGAGKTTLVKLLARLYDPTDGRITVDGTDLAALDPAAWQERIAAVFQDFVRYPFTAADNVGMGAVDRRGDSEALRRAAEGAGALSMIEGLPNGWATVLDRTFIDGVELSGGQWQLIALARALLAASAGAGILVLDEPTAHLDVRAEAAFYDRFLAATHGLTTILVSHRFSTVRRAERIVVLDDGRVVESGTHDDLVARGGRYATMFSLQAGRFTETSTEDA